MARRWLSQSYRSQVGHCWPGAAGREGQGCRLAGSGRGLVSEARETLQAQWVARRGDPGSSPGRDGSRAGGRRRRGLAVARLVMAGGCLALPLCRSAGQHGCLQCCLGCASAMQRCPWAWAATAPRAGHGAVAVQLLWWRLARAHCRAPGRLPHWRTQQLPQCRGEMAAVRATLQAVAWGVPGSHQGRWVGRPRPAVGRSVADEQ